MAFRVWRGPKEKGIEYLVALSGTDPFARDFPSTVISTCNRSPPASEGGSGSSVIGRAPSIWV